MHRRGFVLLDNFYVNAEVSADGHNWSTAAYATDFVEKTWPTNYSRRGRVWFLKVVARARFPVMVLFGIMPPRAGVSYRSYGEFVEWKIRPSRYKAILIPTTLRITCQYRTRSDFEHWNKTLIPLLALDAVPQPNTIRLPKWSHCRARAGSPTPRAMGGRTWSILGRKIEHLSKSKIWKECCVYSGRRCTKWPRSCGCPPLHCLWAGPACEA